MRRREVVEYRWVSLETGKLTRSADFDDVPPQVHVWTERLACGHFMQPKPGRYGVYRTDARMCSTCQ